MEDTYYKLVEDSEGMYKKENKRYSILSCHRAESKETYICGYDDEGEPLYDTRIVINKGWDRFNTFEEAIKNYKLDIVSQEELEALAEEIRKNSEEEEEL